MLFIRIFVLICTKLTFEPHLLFKILLPKVKSAAATIGCGDRIGVFLKKNQEYLRMSFFCSTFASNFTGKCHM